jgi:hypothetical protein
VVLGFGFWARSGRDEKGAGARALGVPVELHCLAAPVDELCRRLEARSREGGPGTVPVGRELLEEYVKLFRVPGDDELASSVNCLGAGVDDGLLRCLPAGPLSVRVCL